MEEHVAQSLATLSAHCPLFAGQRSANLLCTSQQQQALMPADKGGAVLMKVSRLQPDARFHTLNPLVARHSTADGAVCLHKMLIGTVTAMFMKAWATLKHLWLWMDCQQSDSPEPHMPRMPFSKSASAASTSTTCVEVPHPEQPLSFAIGTSSDFPHSLALP